MNTRTKKQEGLPTYVYRRKRDGALLFRKRYGKRLFERVMQTQMQVGDTIPQVLHDEVQLLLNGSPDDKLKYRAPRACQSPDFRSPNGSCLFHSMEKSARARAKKYLFQYDLPRGWCLEKFHTQNGLCAVTGIKFRQDLTKRSPFMPSLDRIDPTAGYTPSNCRLVAYIVNCALGQFGEEALLEMSKAVVAKSQR